MIVPILSVSDVDASLKFYTEKLGFTQSMALPGPDGVTAFAGISMGKVHVMLSRSETEHKGQGVVFMVYVEDDMDIDAYCTKVKANGVKLTEDIKTQYWGDRTFDLHDPDGYVLSFAKTVEQTDMEHVEKVMKGEIPRD